MICVLIKMFVIFILTFLLMIGCFVLMIRLGLFNLKNSSDSLTWQEFKGWLKNLKNEN